MTSITRGVGRLGRYSDHAHYLLKLILLFHWTNTDLYLYEILKQKTSYKSSLLSYIYKNLIWMRKFFKHIDILVILDRLCGRGSWSEHRDQLLGVNNALKDTKIVCEMLRLWLFFTFLQSLVTQHPARGNASGLNFDVMADRLINNTHYIQLLS